MKLRDDKLRKMKCDLQRQQNVFAVMTETNEAAVEASFTVWQSLRNKAIYGWWVCVKAVNILCPKKQ